MPHQPQVGMTVPATVEESITLERQELRWESMDPGIREIVRILWQGGIETTESCEGTPGHCYPEPTVCFEGEYEAGFRALALCYANGLKVKSLHRVWNVQAGEVVGPEWQLVFYTNDGGLHPVETLAGKIEWAWGRPRSA